MMIIEHTPFRQWPASGEARRAAAPARRACHPRSCRQGLRGRSREPKL